MECYFSVPGTCIHTALVYRVPPSQKNKIPRNKFLEEFASLLEFLTILPAHLLILGDININWHGQDKEPEQYRELLSSLCLRQHVLFDTHIRGHTLDHDITREDDTLVQSVSAGDMLADHSTVIASLTITKAKHMKQEVLYRKTKAIDIPQFKSDISLKLVPLMQITDVDLIASRYNNELKAVLDSHAPILTKTVVQRPNKPWYSQDITILKREKRVCENMARKTKLTVHWEAFKEKPNKLCFVIPKLKWTTTSLKLKNVMAIKQDCFT